MPYKYSIDRLGSGAPCKGSLFQQVRVVFRQRSSRLRSYPSDRRGNKASAGGISLSNPRNCCLASIRRRHSSASACFMLPLRSNTSTSQRPFSVFSPSCSLRTRFSSRRYSIAACWCSLIQPARIATKSCYGCGTRGIRDSTEKTVINKSPVLVATQLQSPLNRYRSRKLILRV